MFSEKLMTESEQMIESIYSDPFIQGMIQGDLDKAAVKHYLKADALYLKEFSNLYAMLISKSKDMDTAKQFYSMLDLLMNGEGEAHLSLAAYTGEDYEAIIKDGEWYPSADHYIKHMYFNAYAKEHIAFTISAMAPCPYVYKRVAEMALERNNMSDNHPFKAWFKFYGENDSEALDFMYGILNHAAAHLNAEDILQIKNNFMESVEHERRFFNMAFTKEKWKELSS